MLGFRSISSGFYGAELVGRVDHDRFGVGGDEIEVLAHALSQIGGDPLLGQ